MKAIKRKTIRVLIITALATICGSTFAATQEIAATSKIDPGAGVLTMVNVLTPAPGKQSETIKLLQAGMDNTMRHQPGFISANIHKSLNSEHVVVYAQWKDQASLEAAARLIQTGKAPNMASVFAIAQPAYHPYNVVSVHPAITEKQH